MSATALIPTIAEYFRLGLQIGLLEPAQAVAWADSEIAGTDFPPEGIIDVALSNGLTSTMDALSAVPGEKNKQLAGHWLLALLSKTIGESEEELQLATQRAMQIARYTELGDETYYRFDSIDDELSLARSNVYGSVEQCRIDLMAELAAYHSLELERGA